MQMQTKRLSATVDETTYQALQDARLQLASEDGEIPSQSEVQRRALRQYLASIDGVSVKSDQQTRQSGDA